MSLNLDLSSHVPDEKSEAELEKGAWSIPIGQLKFLFALHCFGLRWEHCMGWMLSFCQSDQHASPAILLRAPRSGYNLHCSDDTPKGQRDELILRLMETVDSQARPWTLPRMTSSLDFNVMLCLSAWQPWAAWSWTPQR